MGKIRTSPVPIYLVPIPREKSVMKQVMKNYCDLESMKEFIILDRTTNSCDDDVSAPMSAGHDQQSS